VIYVFVDQFTPILHDVQQSALYQSRLSSDTMTDRLKFNSMALDLSEKSIFWGVGSKQSSLYFFGMLSTGFGLKWARGEIGGIHNLYLELLFFYGLPLLILFGLFLGSMLRTWIKLIRNNSDFFVLQFGFGLMYCVLNFTNALALHTDLGILFAFIAGAGAFIGGRALNPSPDDLNLR
jgi:O-antigen ligase